MLRLSFSSNLDQGSYIISIAKTASKKIGPLIRSMKFFLLKFFCISINPVKKYCCHVSTGAPSCYLAIPDKLQKQVCRSIGSSLAVSLEPLPRRNVASLNHFTGITFEKRSTHYSDRQYYFSVTIRRCFKDDYVSIFFLCTARPWNFLSQHAFI